MSYREAPLNRICNACQRCEEHCFKDPGCRFALRRECCLTCCGAVVVVRGVDHPMKVCIQTRKKRSKIKGSENAKSHGTGFSCDSGSDLGKLS
jgi:hypothetical protein